MGGFVDITGCAFGELIVIKRGWREHRNAMWWCLCSCGVARLVSSGALISGPAVCCMVCTNERRRVVSRLNNPPRPVVVGTKVGQLTVISGPYIAEMSGIDAEEAWLCLCACGKSVYVDRAKLARTKRFTKSCGCLVHDRMAVLKLASYIIPFYLSEGFCLKCAVEAASILAREKKQADQWWKTQDTSFNPCSCGR